MPSMSDIADLDSLNERVNHAKGRVVFAQEHLDSAVDSLNWALTDCVMWAIDQELKKPRAERGKMTVSPEQINALMATSRKALRLTSKDRSFDTAVWATCKGIRLYYC